MARSDDELTEDAVLGPPTVDDRFDGLVRSGRLLPGTGDVLALPPLVATLPATASERLAAQRDES